MNISGMSITTEEDAQPREIGHAKVSFEWSDFALVEINRIKAGTALSGFTLDDGTTLQFHWPDEYTVYESEGEPQIDPSPSEPAEGSVSWQGDSFTDDQPGSCSPRAATRTRAQTRPHPTRDRRCRG